MHADTLKERARLSALSDEELVLKVQAGETVCFDILVDRYKVRLYNYLLRLLRNEDEAEEIAQETFVKAFIHADKYKTIARFSTWLYTIATNLVRNRLRAKRRAPKFISMWSRGAGWRGRRPGGRPHRHGETAGRSIQRQGARAEASTTR